MIIEETSTLASPHEHTLKTKGLPKSLCLISEKKFGCTKRLKKSVKIAQLVTKGK